jgi:NhaP-type Na+/H+ or K+/H+ antiporter
MKRFGIVLLSAVGGFLCGAFLGYALIALLSSNTHDRSVEAAMTAAFVCGPAGALVAVVAALVRTRRMRSLRGASGEAS